jgi:hypothetical protein
METFAAGWMSKLDKQIETLGKKMVLTYMIGTFMSVLVASCIWFGGDFDGKIYTGFIVMIAGYAATHGMTYVHVNAKLGAEPDQWTSSSQLWYEITLGNVMELRDDLQEVCGWIPWAWAFAMKHFIPQVLLILFINLATSDNADGDPQFGNYGGYSTWPYQVLGIAVTCIAFLLFVIGIYAPGIYKHADLPYMQELAAANGAANDKAMGKQDSSDGAGDDEADA